MGCIVSNTITAPEMYMVAGGLMGASFSLEKKPEPFILEGGKLKNTSTTMLIFAILTSE
jgi:hypothetical protein